MRIHKDVIAQAIRTSINKQASCDVFTSPERILFVLPGGDTLEIDPRKVADDVVEALTLADSYQGGN